MFPLLPHAHYTEVDGAALTRREQSGFEAIVSRHLALYESPNRGTERRDALLADSFEFLNERRTLPLPIDWGLTSVAPVSHLWRFHLHYHEFLIDLLAGSREAGAGTQHERRRTAHERLWAIVDDWICANPIDRPGALSDAWHPFCLSKRIAVWLMAWLACAPPQDARDRVAASLEGQIRFLERHLEWDLRGNHLLENLRTLALAGAFFSGDRAERRLDLAERWLRRQLAEQILPSGEHFERSPMYHAQMLSAVLDVRDAVASIRPELAALCGDVARRMGTFLRAVTHPDGEVALLSDTALGETPSVDVLLRDADLAPAPSCERTGPEVVGDYWTWRDRGDYVLFDAGPIGADELPAHAHCDLLTIEASIGGRRVFVDSGVYDYDAGPMREYCRSTAAHNVLQIDGAEQCDMWSRFRVGYRGHPSPLEHGQSGEFSWCRATHNAYRRLRVPLIGRWLACRKGGPWFCVDWADGDGIHELTVRLHLSPDVSVTSESPQAMRIDVGERSLRLASLTEAGVTIDEGWYCADFGTRFPGTILAMTTKAQLPAHVGWVLHDADCPQKAILHRSEDGRIAVHWQGANTAVTLDPMSP
jgi:uncharacterized heparinase superfamily protein